MARRTRKQNRLTGTQLGITYSKLGASRFDLTDPYHFALTIGWIAFLAFALSVYGLITGLFALLYLASPGCVARLGPGDLVSAFFFSVETMATVSFGEMAPATAYGHIVASAEIIAGMAFIAIMTGLLFVRFSRPRARMVYSDQAVITPYNGRPTLMIRVAHGRSGLLTNLIASLDALVPTTTTEGAALRQLQSLKLVRSSMPMVGLIMTLMHVIDETSPLAPFDEVAMAAAELRFVLGIEARDPDLATVVHDLKTYLAADVRFGMRFSDAILREDDGSLTVDLTRISAIEPDGAA